MSENKYVEINEHGSAVVAGTRIHVSAIGFAYENGYTEQEIIEWFSLNKERLQGVLAYFHDHRDSLIEREIQAERLLSEVPGKFAPIDVSFTDDEVIVTLSNNTKIVRTLALHEWLKNATDEQRQNYTLYRWSIFWEDLDEGLDIEGILRENS